MRIPHLHSALLKDRKTPPSCVEIEQPVVPPILWISSAGEQRLQLVTVKKEKKTTTAYYITRSGYHLAKHCHVLRLNLSVRDLFDHFLS